MLDPAELARVLMGLDDAPAGARRDRRRLSDVRLRRKRVGIRASLARGLRRAAAVLDQRTVGEIADEAGAR